MFVLSQNWHNLKFNTEKCPKNTKEDWKWETEEQKIKGTNRKKVMIDVNPTILIIKLNFNKVNILIKYKNVRID